MREGGAEALAFDVAALAGSQAALPHGSPGPRRVRAGRVLLFDFGAQVAGYRSDMTRTLFVGAPRDRDLAVYDLVARAQEAAISLLERAVAAGGSLPSGRAVDAAARDQITAAGHGAHFGHGTGHGIGLATHERPSLSRVAAGRARSRARPSSRWSPASTLRGGPACGSRISSCSMPPPAGSNA